jgi:hypothetical protein
VSSIEYAVPQVRDTRATYDPSGALLAATRLILDCQPDHPAVLVSNEPFALRLAACAGDALA